MASPPVFKIVPTTQRYDWGKVGLNSKVAQFAAASKIPGFTLDDQAPYAELWMGTHPSSPSRVLGSNELLSKHLAAHPNLMGARVIQRFNAADGNIPFLFKVLAIEKALSIQTHPDKKTAEILHQQQPNVYKDANHKPEMAVALTPFTALCGFLPLPEIAKYLQSTPEFASLIPDAINSEFISLSSSATPSGPKEKAALKAVFSAVMTADAKTFKAHLRGLTHRYKNGEAKDDERNVQDLVLRLNDQFPDDIGVFCAFMLNYVKLEPGEAIFLAAGEPHAYVTGDIMECMATSDNVIRAGLTPKLRDIPNLVSGLTYQAASPEKHLVKPTPFARASMFASTASLYDPPVPEFSVLELKIKTGESENQPPIDGPSIAIVTEGSGSVGWGSVDSDSVTLSVGDVFFIGASTEVKLCSNDRTSPLVIYRAFVVAV
ncbi:hypothetical protein JAAARDRAFT_146519 [Jaapia argillacea MUCL 33604]|uniref:Mannose-6-phosphate isomerase n=1 Tax=Jaapia argillacea MUCL 33604 TaxID=933084 RepID=A0A067QDV3_9AGAM|nr:hypothetical protein JAAARDRAFT_146519 [Jaapia argillacea MUCL 33604]